jgi:UDP-N-acetylglucosamine transferase subunit ALG13
VTSTAMRSSWALSSSDAGPGRADAGGPTVATLVTAGTHEARFHRLERVIAELAGRQLLPAPVIIQTGCTPREIARSASLIEVDFVEPSELVQLMSVAQFVVTHGGPGSIFMALQSGHTPIAVPRSAAHGEHVDDHQSAFVKRMGERGLVHAVQDPSAIEQVIASLSTTRRAQVLPSELAHRSSFLERFAPIADALLRRA